MLDARARALLRSLETQRWHPPLPSTLGRSYELPGDAAESLPERRFGHRYMA
jgi:hypothetical protein